MALQFSAETAASRPRLLFSMLLNLLLFTNPVRAVCYYPNGEVAPQDTACHNNEDTSTCCGQGYACLSNNICMATGDEIQKTDATLYVRGSCTDKTWRSNNCPQFCIIPEFDDMAGGEGIRKCPNTDLDMYYCFDGDLSAVNCTTETNVLIFQGQPSVLTTIGVTASTLSPSVIAASPSTISSLPTADFTSALISHSSTPPSVSTTPGGTPTSGSSVQVSRPASSATQTSSSQHTTAIAVGIAVPLGVIIAAIFCCVACGRRKRGSTFTSFASPGPSTTLHAQPVALYVDYKPPSELQDNNRCELAA